MSSVRSSRMTDWLRLLFSILVLGGFALAAWKLGLFNASTAEKVTAKAAHGPRSFVFPVVFTAIYALVGAFALPTGPLSYGAGAMFGVVRGSIYVWVASMAAATTGFFLARGILGKAARRMLGDHKKKLGNLKHGNVAMTAFRMQLFPLIPFGLFNYAAAISKMPFGEFLIGTAFGIIPGTLLSTFIGDRVIAGVTGNDSKSLFLAVGVAVLFFGLSFLPGLLKKLRKNG